MIKSIGNNWLKPFRIAAGFRKRQALAKAINVHDKTLQRWENYQTSEGIRFSSLAVELKVSEEQLRAAHEAGLAAHRIEQKKQTPIETKYVVAAIDDCPEILRETLFSRLNVGDSYAAANTIVGFIDIKQSRIDEIVQLFNQPIATAIAVSTTHAELDAIRTLIAAIAMAMVVPNQDIHRGGVLQVQGTQQAWALRMFVDLSTGLLMTAIDAKNEVELSNESARAVCVSLPKVEPEDVWNRVREVVNQIANEAFVSEEFDDCPLPNHDNDHKGLREFCEKLNKRLLQTNAMETHTFAYVHEEANDVTTEVLDLLRSLRLLVCVHNAQAFPVLRVNEDELESWIANSLFALQLRREKLNDSESTLRTRENTMKDAASQTFVINGGTNSLSTTSNGVAISTQHNLSDGYKQLIEVLHNILKQTDPDKAEHRQVRADVNEIISHQKTTGQLPANGKNWLKETTDKLNVADKALKLVEQATTLWDKLPGVVS